MRIVASPTGKACISRTTVSVSVVPAAATARRWCDVTEYTPAWMVDGILLPLRVEKRWDQEVFLERKVADLLRRRQRPYGVRNRLDLDGRYRVIAVVCMG